MTIFWAEFAIFIAVIIIGVKKKGTLGFVSIFALAFYVFFLGETPTEAPLKIALLILAIITASSTLGACGGFEYLTYISGRALSRYPKMITIIAPMVAYLFSFLAGSGYVVLSILPMIYEISKKSGIRPERPLTASVIAANQAAIASPISAPTVALIGVLTPYGVNVKTILIVMIISTICGVLCAAISVYNKGKDIKIDDIDIQEKNVSEKREFSLKTKLAVVIFFFTVLLISFFGIFEKLRPQILFNGTKVSMDVSSLIIMLMFSLSALIIFICNVKTSEIFEEQTFKTGANVILTIFGISWLSSTFIACNKGFIMLFVEKMVANNVWIFGVFLFVLSIFICSHTASILALYPLGLTLGISPLYMLALTPTIDSVFILPSYPSIQATLSIDKTGSTYVGKYIINHSFIRPGMVAIVVGLIVSHLLIYFFF